MQLKLTFLYSNKVHTQLFIASKLLEQNLNLNPEISIIF